MIATGPRRRCPRLCAMKKKGMNESKNKGTLWWTHG